jgi:hypothetical protein
MNYAIPCVNAHLNYVEDVYHRNIVPFAEMDETLAHKLNTEPEPGINQENDDVSYSGLPPVLIHAVNKALAPMPTIAGDSLGGKLTKQIISAIALTIASRNYAYNIAQEYGGTDGFINGQGRTEYKDLKYGSRNVEYAGCGVIAVHNALVVLGNPKPFYETLLYFEMNGALLNSQLGTNPLAAVPYFEKAGYTVNTTIKLDEYDKLLLDSDVAIMTYKNANSLSFHTVAIQLSDSEIFIFNESGSTQATKADSIEQFVADDGNTPIILIGIKK